MVEDTSVGKQLVLIIEGYPLGVMGKCTQVTEQFVWLECAEPVVVTLKIRQAAIMACGENPKVKGAGPVNMGPKARKASSFLPGAG